MTNPDLQPAFVPAWLDWSAPKPAAKMSHQPCGPYGIIWCHDGHNLTLNQDADLLIAMVKWNGLEIPESKGLANFIVDGSNTIVYGWMWPPNRKTIMRYACTETVRISKYAFDLDIVPFYNTVVNHDWREGVDP